MMSDIINDPTIDRTWRDVIRLTEVPNAPGLFVLGSFSRRVTVYSQQLRALNFVDALAGQGYLRREQRVAVIGAGFAGLTASASLAKLGVSVTLFDQHSVKAGLQRTCKTRYLHPHIYDWPKKKIEDTDTDLPFLNWSAGNADTVASKVSDDWERLTEKLAVTQCIGEEVTSLSRKNGSWELECSGSGELKQFDLVVAAVGFGVENTDLEGQEAHSYWADLPLKNEEEQKKQWLVSGSGDGALTDVMQLCFRYSDQCETLKNVVRALHDTVQPHVIQELLRKVDGKKGGKELFEGIDPHRIASALNLRSDPIYLNASEESVFGTPDKAPLSSTLNRLVVWMLMEARKVTLRPGRIPESGISLASGGFTVTLENGGNENVGCGAVLLRHGPVPVITSAPWLSNWARQIKRLKRLWGNLYRDQGIDPTLLGRVTGGDFYPARIAPAEGKFSALLLYSNSTLRTTQVDSLKVSFRNLLTRNRVKISLSETNDPKDLRDATEEILMVEETLKNPRSFGSTVQLLCHAPLVVVDGTLITPTIALLLGIRTAVRRGVTVVFHEGQLDVQAWQQLPFNLREIRIVTVTDRHSEHGFKRPLTEAIEEGFRRLAVSPSRYADLPGFSALRDLGGNEEDNSPRPGKAEVLVVCPFDEKFEEKWLLLRDALHEHYFLGEDGDHPATRVVDMTSPEMLSKRLFEALRRNDECVADLTYLKPNVLFEVGVRFAVHPHGARVIEERQGALETPEANHIRQLFGVRDYESTQDGVKQALAMNQAEWSGGSLSSSYVHSIAERCVAPKQEAGGQTVLDVLWDLVASVGGVDRQKQASPPVLYLKNRGIRDNTKKFIFDGLLAYCLLASKLPSSRLSFLRTERAVVELRNLLRDLEISNEEKGLLQREIDDIIEPKFEDTAPQSLLDLVSLAQSTRSNAKELRNKWRNKQAGGTERENDFRKSANRLKSVIKNLENAREAQDLKSLRERDLCSQLADTYGVLGGLYRDWNNYKGAVKSYESGNVFERRVKELGGISGSYCLVQMLINKTLLAISTSARIDSLKEGFEQARAELLSQLSDDRRGDLWLQADIALVTQMINPRHAIGEWDAFEDLSPPSYAYDSASQVVKSLYTALKPILSKEDDDAWTLAMEIFN